MKTSHPSPRIASLDILRGFIIVVMALDHANALVAHGKLDPEMWAGLFPTYGENWLAFLTRAVTHLAAPGFFFLMGAGMALFEASGRKKGMNSGQIHRHFFLRGALLIALQFILENPIWKLSTLDSETVYFGVLYALGGGMILGSLLLGLRQSWLLILSTLMVVSLQTLLPDASLGYVSDEPLRTLILTPGYSEIGRIGIWVLYPIWPWLGVVGLGIAYGRWLLEDRQQALHGALWLGGGSLLVFLLLRLGGSYGNIHTPQAGWIGFFNMVKYPPSLVFLSATMGINLLFLGLLEYSERLKRWVKPLAVFGKVPLFFYLTHLYLYGFLGLWLAQDGMPLLSMYPYWLMGLLVLFPLCILYGRVRPSYPILRYL